MIFQIYGETAGYQLLGWLLVFTGLVVMNEIARRTKAGGIAAAMGSSMPTTADPTAQGVISVLSIMINVLALSFIIKRSIEQKKNPYTNEIFTDTKDFKIAMDRAE